MHTDAFKAQQIGKKKKLSCTHKHKHQRAFVIQQQPVVIDWSICLCIAYKWATWYSALFIWNQLRQRCCVSACSMRALFLSAALSFSVYASEIAAKRKQGGEGKRGRCWEKRAVSVQFFVQLHSLGVSTTRACIQWIQLPVQSAVRHTNWVQSDSLFAALLISICLLSQSLISVFCFFIHCCSYNNKSIK